MRYTTSIFGTWILSVTIWGPWSWTCLLSLFFCTGTSQICSPNIELGLVVWYIVRNDPKTMLKSNPFCPISNPWYPLSLSQPGWFQCLRVQVVFWSQRDFCVRPPQFETHPSSFYSRSSGGCFIACSPSTYWLRFADILREKSVILSQRFTVLKNRATGSRYIQGVLFQKASTDINRIWFIWSLNCDAHIKESFQGLWTQKCA